MCPAAGGTYSLGFFPIILWHPESGEEQPLQVMPRLQAARQDSWKGQHTRHSLQKRSSQIEALLQARFPVTAGRMK